MTVALAPLIFRVDGFVGAKLRAQLRERAAARFAKDGHAADALHAAAALGWGHDGGGADPVLEALSARVAVLTRLPASHQEPAFATRSAPSAAGANANHTKPAFDHWDVTKRQRGDQDVDLLTEGGTTNRAATVVVHLNEPPKGGQLGFPGGQKNTGAVGRGPGCNHPLVLPATEGSAYLLYNRLPDSRGDESSQRAECPVLEGQKWTVTKWVWNKALALSE